MTSTPIVVPGRNCWRSEPAKRAALIVDGADYFDAFVAAAEHARESIFILSWDFNGAVRLGPTANGDASEHSAHQRVDEFLNGLVARRRRLHVYVLNWDYVLLYAFDRQAVPRYRFRWWTHRRFHVQLDNDHPMGASHHQKVVVIDDAIAFVGGLDFAAGRWDTQQHRGKDPRRVDPWGTSYGPYHDLMMAVDGDAAAALGALARERWRRATGKRVRPSSPRSDPWPALLQPDLRDVRVAIARTDPPYEERHAVHEVEHLYLDAIAAARRFIYIENQYLTAERIGTALCARLQEPDGPEIVIVTTELCAGWLEEGTMGVLRARLIERLRAADRYGRLRLFNPVIPDLKEGRYVVHSKAMVVDDVFIRVGSANLNNRSMGLDTECDVAIEADGRAEVSAGIATLHHRLLGEHLDVPPEQVAAARSQSGSLIGAIETLRGNGRTLAPLQPSVPAWLDGVVPDAALIDPHDPLPADEVLRHLGAVERERRSGRRSWQWAVLVVAALGIAAVWRWAPIDTGLTPEDIAAYVAQLHVSTLGPAVVIVTFALAACLFVPVTALIVAMSMAFGPLLAVVYGLSGSVLGAAATFGLGLVLGRDFVRRLAGRRVTRISGRLRGHGVAAVAVLRLLPTVPFPIFNMIAGMLGVRFRDFILGTALGMSPGMFLLALFGDRLEQTLHAPTGWNVATVLGLGLLLGGGSIWLSRWAARRRGRDVRQQMERTQPPTLEGTGDAGDALVAPRHATRQAGDGNRNVAQTGRWSEAMRAKALR